MAIKAPGITAPPPAPAPGGRGFGGPGGGGATTVWQPLPEGPVITISVGSTNVPVTSTAGFEVGQKMALGYGTAGPAVQKDLEKYEVVIVTEVGKPGTQTALAADANAGDTSIRIRATGNISAGDKITLDIDSIDHGAEIVTVKSVSGAAAPGGAMGPTVDGDQLTFVAAPAGAATGAATATSPDGRTWK